MTWRIPNLLPEIFLTGAILFGPLAFGAVEPWSLAALSMLIFATLFFCALRGLPDLSLPIYRTLLPAVLILLLIGLIQSFNPRSILGPATLMPFTVSAYATSRALMLWAMYAAVIWCVPQVFTDLSSVRRLMAVVFGLGCVIAIIGIIQMSQNRLMIYGLRAVPYGYEPFGPYYNRDHAASMLSMAAFCGVGLFWDGFFGDENKRERANAFNFAAVQSMMLFGIGIILIGVLCTVSRGALGAVLIAGFILGVAALRSAKHRFGWFGLAVTCVVIAIVSSPIATRLTGSYIEASAAFRISIYRASLELFHDFAWFGSGLGAFQQAYYPYQPKAIEGVVEHAHSDWLEILLQVGILGLSAYLLGLGRFLFRIVSTLLNPSRHSVLGLSCGVGAAVLAFLLHGLIDFSFQIPANAVLFFMLLAVAGVLANVGGSSVKLRLSAHQGKARSAVAVIALALFVISSRPAVAFWFAQSAKNEPATARAKSLVKAIEWDANPRYYDDLSRLQSALASELPESRRERILQAVAESEYALQIDPANPRFRDRVGYLLDSLGRNGDARSLAGNRW